MSLRILRPKLVVPLCVAVIVACGSAAVALSGVLSQQVVADTSNVNLRIVRTAANGFDSGWHIHPGVAIVQVQEGSMQIYQNTCAPTTVSAGQTYIEIPHLAVRAVATGAVSWTTTLITSAGGPAQIPASSYYNNSTYNPCPSVP